ncbi:hypothetical protein [Mesorhizobium ciceri]|uniref:Uncharacterized protein n=1 Tax=Mesorhizobium ciceri biovar biserrulae (strain HAMBI 2942 / LMG 23838 / WSM1271) TaxID=765698 RepID=E8T7R8_MESCW|nr:hypothetical protein [Mesorhizobium ciceri]ADV12919.1 hypothetical protein Mesci_3802 [Mesorhizobium ciceri biovar biserrulae WSM1271]
MSAIVMAAIVATFCYPLISSLILKMTERTRDEFADLVRKLLVDPSVSEDRKVFISSMVDDVFDWRFMAMASVVFPLVVLTHRVERDLTGEDRAFFEREDAKRLIVLHMKSVMAASPIFTIVFLITSTLALLLKVFSLGMSIRILAWADTVKNVSPAAGRHHFMRLAS